MKFKDFQKRIESISRLQINPDHLHDALLPMSRAKRNEALKQDINPKLGAVAAIVYPKAEESHILLIERAPYDGVHSAQVSFPGGKTEDNDDSFIDTAIRETQEEVGVSAQYLNLIRPLSKLYIPPSRFLVHPYLFHAQAPLNFTPDPREVNRVLEYPLRMLLDDSTLVTDYQILRNGLKIKAPYFAFEDFKIWGATAMMLNEIKHLLKQPQ